MKKQFAGFLLVLVLTLTFFPISVLAAEGDDWLIPKMRDYASFTDVAGTICRDAAPLCCKVGLMEGVDGKHFMPQNGLTHAQIIVVSARFHRLLSGETLEYFKTISLKGPDWWKPYDGYLRQEIPELSEDQVYVSMTELPTYDCLREEFFHILACVLEDTGTALPEINNVSAVPDCCDQSIIQFYRWGVLNGKSKYGALLGRSSLSRGAAAAMLARLIDPQQRLAVHPIKVDLCRELLGVEPETVLMTISGREITAAQYAARMVSVYSAINHSHQAGLSMIADHSAPTPRELTAKYLCKWVLCEQLAKDLPLELPSQLEDYYDGYQCMTKEQQAWEARFYQVTVAVEKTVDAGRLLRQMPEPEYTEAWETIDFTDMADKVAALPYWGGGMGKSLTW